MLAKARHVFMEEKEEKVNLMFEKKFMGFAAMLGESYLFYYLFYNNGFDILSTNASAPHSL
jgi:hypothetical protein